MTRPHAGDGSAGPHPRRTQRSTLPLTSRLSAPYTGSADGELARIGGTGAPPEGLIAENSVTSPVYADYPHKALRELCTKRKRTPADEHEITECLAEAAHFGMDVNVYAKLLADQKSAA